MARQFQTPDDVIRASQRIATGLVFGAIMFMGVAYGVAQTMEPQRGGQTLSLILAAASFPQLILFFLIPKLVSQANITSQHSRFAVATPEMKPYVVQLTQTIIKFAMLEGGSLMNGVAYIIEQNWWSLGISGMFILFMLSNFPTQTRFHHYAETQQHFSD